MKYHVGYLGFLIISVSCSSVSQTTQTVTEFVSSSSVCPTNYLEELPIVEVPLLLTLGDSPMRENSNYMLHFSTDRRQVALVDRFEGCIAFSSINSGTFEQIDMRVPVQATGLEGVLGYLPTRRYVDFRFRLVAICLSPSNNCYVDERDALDRLSASVAEFVKKWADRNLLSICEASYRVDSVFVGLSGAREIIIWEAVAGQLVQ